MLFIEAFREVRGDIKIDMFQNYARRAYHGFFCALIKANAENKLTPETYELYFNHFSSEFPTKQLSTDEAYLYLLLLSKNAGFPLSQVETLRKHRAVFMYDGRLDDWKSRKPYDNPICQQIDFGLRQLDAARNKEMSEEEKELEEMSKIHAALDNDDIAELIEVLTNAENRIRAVVYAITVGLNDPKHNTLVIAVIMKFPGDWPWRARIEALRRAHAYRNEELFAVIGNEFYKSYYDEISKANRDRNSFERIFIKYTRETDRLIDPLGSKLIPLIMSNVASVNSPDEKIAILKEAREASKYVAQRYAPERDAYVNEIAYRNVVCETIDKEIAVLEMMHGPRREGTHNPVFFGRANEYKFGRVKQPTVYELDEAQSQTFELYRI